MKSLLAWVRRKCLNWQIGKLLSRQRSMTAWERKLTNKFFWRELEKQKPLEPDAKEILHKNLWDLMLDTPKKEISVAESLQELYTPPPIQKPVDYGTAVAFVEPGFYATWMESIRSQLPPDVKIGRDIMAYVTFGNSIGQQKVTWKAKTARGNEYLMAMMETLSRPELSETKKLENKQI